MCKENKNSTDESKTNFQTDPLIEECNTVMPHATDKFINVQNGADYLSY